MANLILILLVAPWLALSSSMETVNDTKLPVNYSDPNKDMYVIHAMVYQVGILTNKTDNETTNLNTTGNQEAVTFYHTNGSQGLDLSKIPAPLMTNVTAQSMIGMAPVPVSQNGANQIPWSTLNNLANVNQPPASTGSELRKTSSRSIRSINTDLNSDTPFSRFYKSLFKRNAPGGDNPVSIHSGSAVVPSAAGVQSIALPPLLTLNNNMSNIPVPIPNTSVVHYARINTLVTKP